MNNRTSSARTVSEWWDRKYAREHFIVGVLVGFLLAAIFGLPFGAFLAAMSGGMMSTPFG